MGFYYFSILSLAAFVVYFAIALLVVLIVWLRFKLAKGWLLLLIPTLFIAPWVEELWIAYNFGQLCRKDAGIFINRTVEVEGYYDASALLGQIYTPTLPATAESFDQRGELRISKK